MLKYQSFKLSSEVSSSDTQAHIKAVVTLGTLKEISPLVGPRQANWVLIAYASSEGSGEPAHPHSLARTSAARSYKQ